MVNPYAFSVYSNLDGNLIKGYAHALTDPAGKACDVSKVFELDGRIWHCYGSSSGPVVERDGHEIIINSLSLQRFELLSSYRGSPAPFCLAEYELGQFRRGSIVKVKNTGDYVSTGERGLIIWPVSYFGNRTFEHPKTLDWLFEIGEQTDCWCLRCTKSWVYARPGDAPPDCVENWGSGLVANDPTPNNESAPHYLVFRHPDGTWRKPMFTIETGTAPEAKFAPVQLSLF